MPKAGLVGTSDISWGMGTFTRINRLDPSSQVTMYQVNADIVPYSGANVNSSTVAGAFHEYRTSAPGVMASSRAQTSSIGAAVSGAVSSGLVGVSSLFAGISGVVASGVAAISGVVLSTHLSISTRVAAKMGVPLPSGSGWRMDIGTASFSGWVYPAVSTGISSILHGWTAPVVTSGDWATSGMLGIMPKHSFSGHCLDIYKWFAWSGEVTSCGVSSKVTWGVVGV